MSETAERIHNPLRAPADRRLTIMIAVSLAVHLALFAAIVIKQRLLSGSGSRFSEKIIAARLVKLGTPPRKLKRREMPRKVVAPPPERASAALPGAEGKASTRRRASRVDYDKEMSAALEQIRAQVTEEDKREDLPDDLPLTPGSPDGVPEGDVIDPKLANMANSYVARIGWEIRKKGGWSVPRLIPRDVARGLTATVVIRFDASGTLLERTMGDSSGNDLFDNAALSTVRRVKQVSAPPSDLPDPIREELLSEGLEILFTGRSVRR